GTQRGTGYGYSLWEFEVYGSGAAATPSTAATPTNTPTPTPGTPGSWMGTNFWNIQWQARNEFKTGVNWSTTTDPWNPTFINEMQGMKVIRPMDWVPTNGSNVTYWSQRIAKTADHYSTIGVAYEWQIDLCNRVGADLWVTIPHQANADYSYQLANLIKNNLNSSLKVYVEYSNETWNFGFSQASYCRDRGVALGLHPDQYTAGFLYHVYAAVRVFEQFERVFGTNSPRIVKVLAGQQGNAWMAGLHLDALSNTTINPSHITANAYAIAPYFGHDIPNGAASDAVTQLRDAIYSQAKADTQAVYNTVHPRGYPLLAYEGGQHVYQSGADVLNRKPDMYSIYMEYFTQMKPYYQVFCHYNHVSTYGSGGAWGSEEYIGQSLSTAHKRRAIVDFINNN
ncbi:MAG: hypothetical protein ACM3WV_10020, partial [Bacillota bacterium]